MTWTDLFFAYFGIGAILAYFEYVDAIRDSSSKRPALALLVFGPLALAYLRVKDARREADGTQRIREMSLNFHKRTKEPKGARPKTRTTHTLIVTAAGEEHRFHHAAEDRYPATPGTYGGGGGPWSRDEVSDIIKDLPGPRSVRFESTCEEIPAETASEKEESNA